MATAHPAHSANALTSAAVEKADDRRHVTISLLYRVLDWHFNGAFMANARVFASEVMQKKILLQTHHDPQQRKGLELRI